MCTQEIENVSGFKLIWAETSFFSLHLSQPNKFGVAHSQLAHIFISQVT